MCWAVHQSLSITALGSAAASSLRRRRWKTGWKSWEKDWGWSRKIPIFCRYGALRSQLKAARRNVIKSGKVKAVGAMSCLISSLYSRLSKGGEGNRGAGRGQGKDVD